MEDQSTPSVEQNIPQAFDDAHILTILMSEVRNALRQASYFKNYKKGQIVLSFDKNGTYAGVIITLKD